MSDFETYLLSVIRGRKGALPSLMRGVLEILACVHLIGLEFYLWLYKVRILKQKRLPCLVVCVGNITTGGTGKTPLTQTLCHNLKARDQRIVILSRGYGGANEHGCAVVSDGERVLLTAQEAGDEAFLLATSLPGIPVVVGKDRRKTGALACERFQPDIIVLDDGMQRWQLHKDVILCLLNACEPFDNGWVFPRGLLREPKSHLRRAQVIILTNAKRAGEATVEALRAEVKHLAPLANIIATDLVPVAVRTLEGKEVFPPDWLRGKRVVTIAALGNPASFEGLVESLGGILVGTHRYRDHAALSQTELERVLQEARSVQADLVLTTEKDAVKLPFAQSTLRIYTLQVRMALEEPTLYDWIIKALY